MIDILLATYNGEKYLQEQLDSLLQQSFQDFQVLVRDDGSNDKTIELIEKNIQKYPDKFKLIKDEMGNLGSSRSFMKLLEYSKSEFIMFCDQDDVWLPNKIELSLNKIIELEKEYTSNTPLLVFSDLKVVDENLNTIKNSFWEYQKLMPNIVNNWKKLLSQNVITGCTIIINKQANNHLLPFSLDIMIHDHWIGVHIAKIGKINYLKEQTILYRQHGCNVAGAHSYDLDYIKKKIFDIKNILNFQYKASKHFKDVNILELIYYKSILSIKRFIK